ncbi:Nucleolar protein 58 like [Verticillium longisporum]|nr:Nucleolar protein 58 like [Verticillium longisporum]
MSLFVLAETPAGYGLFKAADKKLLKREELTSGPTSSEQINDMLKLKSFVKFDSSAIAVEEASGLREGRVPPMLANLLNEIKDEKKASLAVADLENLLRKLEGKPPLPKGANIAPDGSLTAPAQFTLNEVRKYNADADGVDGAEVNGKADKKAKKAKKTLIQEVEMKDADSEAEDSDDDMEDAPGSPSIGSVSDDTDGEKPSDKAEPGRSHCSLSTPVAVQSPSAEQKLHLPFPPAQQWVPSNQPGVSKQLYHVLCTIGGSFAAC